MFVEYKQFSYEHNFSNREVTWGECRERKKQAVLDLFALRYSYITAIGL